MPLVQLNTCINYILYLVIDFLVLKRIFADFLNETGTPLKEKDPRACCQIEEKS